MLFLQYLYNLKDKYSHLTIDNTLRNKMTGDAVFLIEGAGLLEFVGWWFLRLTNSETG
jgi:hypothetical protein